MRRDLLQLFYLASAILFVMGLRGLSHPRTARRGMFLAELGMLLAIIGSLLHHEIIDYRWIAAGLGLGTAIGVPMAIWIPMTAVPQRTALSHSFGALAAALIGISEYYRHGAALGSLRVGVIALEVMLGSLTFTGSLMAAGKLQGLIRGYPITYRGQNVSNLLLLAAMLGLIPVLMFVPTSTPAFYTLVGLAFFFGVMLVLPIGAADMPVVIALLNSYAGLPGPASRPGGGGRAEEQGRRRALRHPRRRRAHARAHERAPRRGQRALRRAVRHGSDQLLFPGDRRGGGGGSQRRRQPRREAAARKPDLRDAHPGSGESEGGDRLQTEPGRRLRRHRQRALLRGQDADALRRREGDDGQAHRRSQVVRSSAQVPRLA